jgi:hypothetical protein
MDNFSNVQIHNRSKSQAVNSSILDQNMQKEDRMSKVPVHQPRNLFFIIFSCVYETSKFIIILECRNDLSSIIINFTLKEFNLLPSNIYLPLLCVRNMYVYCQGIGISISTKLTIY